MISVHRLRDSSRDSCGLGGGLIFAFIKKIDIIQILNFGVRSQEGGIMFNRTVLHGKYV